MKKIKRMIIWVLTLSMLFSLVAYAEDKISIEEYTITKPYQYPIVPGTKEWSELGSLDEMIRVCQIPEEILSKMSTEALIETVLNYPLALNMFAFNTPQEGYMSVKSYFNGIQELESRSDAIEQMNYRMSNLAEKNRDEVDVLIEQVIYTALSSSMVEKEVEVVQ